MFPPQSFSIKMFIPKIRFVEVFLLNKFIIVKYMYISLRLFYILA